MKCSQAVIVVMRGQIAKKGERQESSQGPGEKDGAEHLLKAFAARDTQSHVHTSVGDNARCHLLMR